MTTLDYLNETVAFLRDIVFNLGAKTMDIEIYGFPLAVIVVVVPFFFWAYSEIFG